MGTLEYPPQDYYPRTKIRLIIRFEEYGRALLTPKVPSKTNKNLDGVLDPRNNLAVTKDPNAPDGVQRFLLQRGSVAGPPGGYGSAQAQDSSGDKLTHVLAGIVPKSADWNNNGLRIASTLNASIKYIDAPLDARTIRSCAIEYYQGCISAEEYASGVRGLTRGDVFGSGVPNAAEPMDMIADTYLDEQGRQRTNLRFQGWVDVWTVDWGSGEPMIHFECRDNTAQFIEQQQPPKLVLSMTLPIDQAIVQYLSHFPQFQGLSVEYRPKADKIPILGDVLGHTAYRPNLGPPVSRGGGAEERHSVWDYLVDVCGSIGHAIYVEGTTLVIARVRTLYSSAQVNRPDDPFQGRSSPDGTSWNFRRFIYGRNILTMKASRNFTKRTATNIEVRCYSPEVKNVLVARFPLPQDRLAWTIPGDAQPDQKWAVYKLSGIKDIKTLRIVAQNIYEALGRAELDTEIKLRNMASFGGGNLDPDILDMKVGDTVEILTNRDDAYSTLTQIEKNLSAQQRNAQFMSVLGFSDEFSQAYAAAYTDAGFQTTFKLRSMSNHWDTEQGVSITLHCVNYVEVRADKFLASGEEPNVTQPSAPKPPVQNKPAAQQQAAPGPHQPPPPDNPPPPDTPPKLTTQQKIDKLKAEGYTDDQIDYTQKSNLPPFNT